MAKISLQLALDMADTLTRVLTSMVTMIRASWLQNIGIASDVQQTIEDLPSIVKCFFQI